MGESRALGRSSRGSTCRAVDVRSSCDENAAGWQHARMAEAGCLPKARVPVEGSAPERGSVAISRLGRADACVLGLIRVETTYSYDEEEKVLVLVLVLLLLVLLVLLLLLLIAPAPASVPPLSPALFVAVLPVPRIRIHTDSDLYHPSTYHRRSQPASQPTRKASESS